MGIMENDIKTLGVELTRTAYGYFLEYRGWSQPVYGDVYDAGRVALWVKRYMDRGRDG